MSADNHSPNSDEAEGVESTAGAQAERAAATASAEQPAQPEWSQGLRQLYDSVVDEPLPDSFQDLLAKLDDQG